MDAVLAAKSGHIGLPMGGAEMGVLLYFAVMNHDPKHSQWVNRDRFVLSAGHGSMLQYSLLHLAGYDVSLDHLRQFRKLDGVAGHPEYRETDGVECTTGPLGQGIAMAVGMALSERMLQARFANADQKTSLIDHRTFVLAGDGCLMEGVSSEASSLAGVWRLNRLIMLYDDNKITIDGHTDIAFTENVGKRYEAYGWNVLYADGNDFDSLAKAMEEATNNASMENGSTGPTLIVCRTVPGKGSPQWENNPKIHGNPMSADDVLKAKQHLGIKDTTPFQLPDDIHFVCQKLLQRQRDFVQNWEQLKQKTLLQWEENHDGRMQLWQIFFEGKTQPFQFADSQLPAAHKAQATRVAGGQALAILAQQDPRLVGGSADLAGSTNTTLPETTFIHAKDFSGRNIHFGVREHGMGAICNGIALHGAFLPYCSTFLVFSDYMRPTIRLAAIMKIPTIFIFTHDSFSVGEDGPTHQPIEHVPSLRLIPNCEVVRPADGMETFLAWERCLQTPHCPTVFCLTRQNVTPLDSLLPKARKADIVREGMAEGSYIVKRCEETDEGAVTVTFLASGSEVLLALQAGLELEKEGVKNAQETLVSVRTQIVSCPAPQKMKKNLNLLEKIIPEHTLLVAIEAANSHSFAALLGKKGCFLGIEQFGASAPAADLAEHFHFTVPQIKQKIQNYICEN